MLDKRAKLYQSYEGEDFAKYMDDDSERWPQPNTTSLVRKVQQRRRQQQQYLDKAPKAPRRPPPQKSGGFKQRLSQAFTFNRSNDKSKYVYQPQNLTSIHQFSFMDSKMGNYSDEHEIQDYMETRSDLGGARRQRDSSSSAWQHDTLSMSTLRKAKRLLDAKQNSLSVPDLPRAVAPATRGDSQSDLGADIKRKKKVNRFKFWKKIGRKRTTPPSDVTSDDDQHVMDVRL